ncbi:MAG: ornithine cyclodeaminase family protein [Thermoplasmatota archaeon]
MLYLGPNEIFDAVELTEVVDVIENALKLYESDEFEMPTRMHVDYDNNTLLLMPCFAEKRVGTKLLTLTPRNREKDKPVIQGCFILNDSETGEILSIIEGSSLTALRTGAVGAVGVKHTTPKEVSSLGIVGAGVQGFHQALYATEVRDIEDVYVYDINKDQAKVFNDRLSKERNDLNITIVSSSRELLKTSNVVITTTTSKKPVLPNNIEFVKNKHFIGIGSYKPEMREFPRALFDELDGILIDTKDAIHESGDIVVPLERGWIDEGHIHTMGKLLNEDIDIDVYSTTFFKSVGMALFDLLTANLIYKKARESGTEEEIG